MLLQVFKHIFTTPSVCWLSIPTINRVTDRFADWMIPSFLLFFVWLIIRHIWIRTVLNFIRWQLGRKERKLNGGEYTLYTYSLYITVSSLFNFPFMLSVCFPLYVDWYIFISAIDRFCVTAYSFFNYFDLPTITPQNQTVGNVLF